MVAKPMPTGQEPPKGYEALLADLDKDHDALRIDRVAATQLSSLEKREINRIRDKAFSLIRTASANADLGFSFEDEISLWPAEKEAADKIIYRGYYEGALRGYALVITGWPRTSAWTIQHIVVDPDYRKRGSGQIVVEAIEQDIRETTEGIEHLVSLPLALMDNSFWSNIGFDKGEGMNVTWAGKDYELEYFHKAIG